MYGEVIEVGFYPVGMVSLQEEEMRTRWAQRKAQVGQERTAIHKPKKEASEEIDPDHTLLLLF